jgi:hypothetical protein
MRGERAAAIGAVLMVAMAAAAVLNRWRRESLGASAAAEIRGDAATPELRRVARCRRTSLGKPVVPRVNVDPRQSPVEQ